MTRKGASRDSATKDPRGGHNRKSVEQHLLDGTYRADRHGPLSEAGDLCQRPGPRMKSKCGRPQRWSQSSADDFAISNGCWFDEKRAAYVVEWFKEHLRFSDSVWAGKPFELLDWQRNEIVYPLFGWMRKDERGRTVRRFNMTYIEIPKKNGKSTIASGIGLHMLVGEGNRGNEVYSAATDKDQASIVHGEAIRMVEASPQLSGFLKVNHSTRHIYNREHNLTYKAVSSRPAGNEGLKGNCCIIDELHAWYGDELWNALRYMGVNWPERLIFVITTAGDDPESVCFRQYEYAKSIERGETTNDRMLVCIHEADPEDDIEDEAVQRKANPSLGHTILREDLMQNIAEDKRLKRTLSSLLRYRFNVWQRSSNAWLESHVWDAAEDEPGELESYPCWCALDLAKKRDMTALAMLFQRESDLYLLCRFWLPEATAHRWRDLASYADWEKSGWLTLTPGDVADFNAIESDIIGLCERHRPQQLGFDPLYAEQITQNIMDATGVERIEFPQRITTFTAPTTAFERMLINGELKHEKNGLLGWQAGNAEVYTDCNQNIRPVKPERDSHKSIDGIVASIMALGLQMEQPAYDSSPSVVLL